MVMEQEIENASPEAIHAYLKWLEENDPELERLYEEARFRGIIARVHRGKSAANPRW